MKKLFKVAIQMDPLESININSDSTYILALEAQNRGYKLFHYTPDKLNLENNRVSAEGNFFKLFHKKNNFFERKKTTKVFLDTFDVILVRQDPPFNMNYVTSTYLLERVGKKTLILNNPKSIRDNSEKLSMFNFPKIIPPTLISKNIQECLKFHKKYKITIIKPLYGNGGEGIEKVEGSLTSAKRKTPKIEKIYKNRTSKPPILVRAGKTKVKVSRITLICFAFCTNFKTLDILSALMKVVEAPKSSSKLREITLLTIEVITIIMSKMFPPSLK